MHPRVELPEGNVTFVFSDVEGSTGLLERNPTLYGIGIARHHELLEHAIERHGGVVFETIGDASTMSLGFSLIQLGELEAAREALQGSVDALLQVGDLKLANGCLIALGMAARFSGENELAETHYERALGLCAEAGDPANAPVCLEGIAAAIAGSDPARAARLLGAARCLFDAGDFPTVPGFEVFYETTLAQLDDGLGDELDGLLATGRADASLPPAEIARS